MSRPKMFTGPGTSSEHKPHSEETRKKIGTAVRTRAADRKEDALLRAAAAYLPTIGWSAVVISVRRIEQDLGEQNSFRLVLNCTGRKAAS